MKNNFIDGNNITVTGTTLGENLERWVHKHGELSSSQDVIRPLDKPIKATGHIRFVPSSLGASAFFQRHQNSPG
jgi:dihydroxy-acid dehydratase